MKSTKPVTDVIKNKIGCGVIHINTCNYVMYIIVNNSVKIDTISMKKANWLKNQDAKPLTYVLLTKGNMAVGLPWRKAFVSMPISLARITQSGGCHEVPNIL
jgi:hypothetical protein